MKKENVNIEQQFLFGAKGPAAHEKAPVKAVPAYKSAPALNLLAGLDKTALKADGIYWLRVLANQYNRGLPADQAKRNLVKTIQSEIAIKKGRGPIELVVMDALLRRHASSF
ncbi:hypothetical protein [Candidatus Finniella inopinata]|uniref:Uncharacterized protein n=1 Tax=Candidatus Finniella inopinata TaxID=1696036 RepID=A0A4Q7DPA9_9PROT|nr:hypothetical protein [Candidatus Finniella inopinata]RZI46816.1 hypothetical protein EQU50_00900 [Candidatus Finniella inopinata]